MMYTNDGRNVTFIQVPYTMQAPNSMSRNMYDEDGGSMPKASMDASMMKRNMYDEMNPMFKKSSVYSPGPVAHGMQMPSYMEQKSNWEQTFPAAMNNALEPYGHNMVPNAGAYDKSMTMNDWRLQSPLGLEGMGMPNWEKPFPVVGQGTVIYSAARDMPFSLVVKQKDQDKWFALEVHPKMARFIIKCNEGPKILIERTGEHVGLDPGRKISYWLSYDRDNLLIKYGKGYRMDETTVIAHDFLAGLSPEEQKKKRAELDIHFNPIHPKFISHYDLKPEMREKGSSSSKVTGLVSIESTVQFDSEPFITNFSPFILDSTKVDLMLLDKGDFMFSASLPPACQELYQNVASTDIDWRKTIDGCKLSDAIRHSIKTPGCILHDRLKAKGVGKDPKETYLRVTMGNKYGSSPGVPYVLEIWPSGHFSPIHNHGNSYAVIKVLFGTITVRIYNKQALADNATEFDRKELRMFYAMEGALTWISPTWFQTHKLWNQSDDFCATVQCYKYAKEDTMRWPYFDYLDETEQIEEFLPSSDFTFQAMHTQVLKEFHNRHNGSKY